MVKFSHLINKLRPLNGKEKVSLNTIEEYILDPKRLKLIKNLLKNSNISIEFKKLELTIAEKINYPVIIFISFHYLFSF